MKLGVGQLNERHRRWTVSRFRTHKIKTFNKHLHYSPVVLRLVGVLCWCLVGSRCVVACLVQFQFHILFHSTYCFHIVNRLLCVLHQHCAVLTLVRAESESNKAKLASN